MHIAQIHPEAWREFGVILAVVVGLMIFAGLAGATHWLLDTLDKKDSSTPETETVTTSVQSGGAEPFVEHNADANDISALESELTSFFDHMRRKARSSLGTADLDIVQGSAAQARCKSLYLSTPRIGINLECGCWQYSRRGDVSENGWHSVIFTLDREWVILGSDTVPLLTGGRLTFHGAIPQCRNSLATRPLTQENIDLLREGMRRLLSRHP